MCLAACGGSGESPDGGVDAGPDATAPSLMVETTGGTVEGFDNNGVYSFRAIPYAAPPVGALRWKPPAPVIPWEGTLDASEIGASCAQLPFNGLAIPGAPPPSEDCLFVNVDVPSEGANMPVMVWIHGGGFILGESTQQDGGTQGDRIARNSSTIVVSVNYRLAQLGFLAHSALTAESPDNASGNYGMLDQVAALEWVHDNIAAFGGDPNNVTLFGESAGAFSICAHLASPLSAGLFHKAILQSGNCQRPWSELSVAEAQGDVFADELGCGEQADVLACMRGKTADEVLHALAPAENFGVTPSEGLTGSYGPIFDGYFQDVQPATAFASGDFNQVPVITGFNADEARLFVWLAALNWLQPVHEAWTDGGMKGDEPTVADYDAVIDEGYNSFVTRLVGENAKLGAQTVAQYPPDDGSFDAFSAASSDAIFRCPGRLEAAALAEHTDVYLYQFEYTEARFQLETIIMPPFQLLQGSLPAGGLGAFHSADISYVFGYDPLLEIDLSAGINLVLNPLPEGADQELWLTMMGYWTRFAATGDPNGEGATNWPVYDATDDMGLSLNTSLAVNTGLAADRCAFWEAHPEYLVPVF